MAKENVLQKTMNSRTNIAALFPSIEPAPLHDRIVAMLKDAFFSGKLKPGDLLVERELARQMNTGSPPIREALFTLQEQGFVRRVANKGTYVTRFTGEEVEQVYLLRTELELLGLRWAKSRVTEGDLLELERTGDGVVDAARRRDARLYYERDLTFHRQCWGLSGNKFLCRSLERIVSPLFAFVISNNETAMAETVAREHLNIVNALRNLQEPEFSSTIRSILSGFALTGCRQWRG